MIPVQIKGKNTEVADPLRKLVEEKIGRLDRYLDDIAAAEVVVTREATKSQEARYVIQATLSTRGAILRAEERAAETRTALDAVVGALHRQIERYKAKLYHKSKAHQAARAEARPLESAPTGAQLPAAHEMVRVKRMPVKPMFEDEAVEQMELLGHDFFVFFNASNEQLNVVYRRENGGYGLLVPEVD